MKRPLLIDPKSLVLLLALYTIPEAVEASAVSASLLVHESNSNVENIPRWLSLRKNQGQHTVSLLRGGAAGLPLKAEKRVIPTLFSDEEEGAMEYDTYAACLAATEGLRRIRDRQRLVDPDAARRQYVRDSKTVLDTMGMTLERFNVLGAQVASDEELKEKIIQQAFLYRAASSVTMDRYPLLAGGSLKEKGVGSVSKSKLQNFCQSMAQVESLRLVQAERLKAHFRMDGDLPSNLSDPAMLPLLSSPVREMVESFPVAAAAIAQQHGLECEEFNRMLSASRSNPILRWKVKQQMQKLVNQ